MTGLTPVFRAAVAAILSPVVFHAGDVDPLADGVPVAVADVLETRMLLRDGEVSACMGTCAMVFNDARYA